MEQQNLNTNFSYFNLTTGTLGARHASHTNHSITPLGNGYYRCSITFVATSISVHSLKLHLRNADGQATIGTGIIGSGIFVWAGSIQPWSCSNCSSANDHRLSVWPRR